MIDGVGSPKVPLTGIHREEHQVDPCAELDILSLQPFALSKIWQKEGKHGRILSSLSSRNFNQRESS